MIDTLTKLYVVIQPYLEPFLVAVEIPVLLRLILWGRSNEEHSWLLKIGKVVIAIFFINLFLDQMIFTPYFLRKYPDCAWLPLLTKMYHMT